MRAKSKTEILDSFAQRSFRIPWDVFVNILVSIDIGLDTFLYLLIDFPRGSNSGKRAGKKSEIFNSRVSDRISPPISKTVRDLLCEQIYPPSQDILISFLHLRSSSIYFVDLVQTVEQISERGEI